MSETCLNERELANHLNATAVGKKTKKQKNVAIQSTRLALSSSINENGF